MNNVLTALILFGGLAAIVLFGRTVRRHLPDHHLSGDSKDAVKLAMGLVATMTALLLGLLVSSSKGTYDTERTEVIQMAAKVTFLDRVLHAYGPEAADAREKFHTAVAAEVQRLWPDQTVTPARALPRSEVGDAIYAEIQQLSPHDDVQRGLKTQAATLAADLGQLRMLLQAQMVPSIPQPLLISVFCWLVILFLSFSLLAPPNATTTLSLIAAAASVAVAVFLIMELDQPLGGFIRISSEPLLNALSQFAK
jgi:hypothetical protein